MQVAIHTPPPRITVTVGTVCKKFYEDLMRTSRPSRRKYLPNTPPASPAAVTFRGVAGRWRGTAKRCSARTFRTNHRCPPQVRRQALRCRSHTRNPLCTVPTAPRRAKRSPPAAVLPRLNTAPAAGDRNGQGSVTGRSPADTRSVAPPSRPPGRSTPRIGTRLRNRRKFQRGRNGPGPGPSSRGMEIPRCYSAAITLNSRPLASAR